MEKKHNKTKIIVVKIGSAVMLKNDGSLDEELVRRIAHQVDTLRRAGIFILLVVSGAVAIGRRMIGRKTSAVDKQIAAGVGQAYITSSYWHIFHNTGILLSQFLLTKSQMHTQNLVHLRNALLSTMHQGVVPLLNENDAVLPNCFGGNDHLAANISRIVNADELIILTNVDGLFKKQNTGAHVIHDIPKLTKDIFRLAWKTKSASGIGGMQTKLTVARQLSHKGIPTIIANGQTKNILTRLILDRQHIGTWIYSQKYAPHI